jgi:hypothetical protein
MSFEKGKSGNPIGRPKGAQNKSTKQLRQTITSFLEDNFENVVNDFQMLSPKDKSKFYCDLLQYSLPKLQSVEIETEFDRLTEDQLDYLLNKLSNGEIK